MREGGEGEREALQVAEALHGTGQEKGPMQAQNDPVLDEQTGALKIGETFLYASPILSASIRCWWVGCLSSLRDHPDFHKGSQLFFLSKHVQ